LTFIEKSARIYTMEGIKKTNTNPQVIYSWKAPLRAYKKRSKHVLRFYLALALLLSLIVFFFGDRVLLIPILSLLFLFYVLTITPPPETENKITRFGIEAAGATLRWENLSHFYFKKRFGFVIITIVGVAPSFRHAYMVVPNEEIKNRVFKILTEHIVFQEKPHKEITEKLVDILTKLIPEETSSSKPQQASL